jgi:uncharacterized membrane protein YphA (DoxX/SURF4 family)
MPGLVAAVERAVFGPRPIVRLAAVRILAPLAILGFMASRIAHADDWLSDVGFRVPALSDWRQPISLPALPLWMAWSVCAAMVVSGLATALGAATRWSSAVFAALLAYVALADRLAAFTVSKLAPVVVLALCLSPSGARYSIDAWRRRRRDPAAAQPVRVSGGCVAFFQFLLPVFYFSSGWSKATGDWLSERYVLWTHLHDSYQTTVSWLLANHLPAWMWTAIQGAVLAFECGAPVWFAVRYTRPYALGFGVAMHLGIGLMFGPVIWFSLLMITLLVASYAPERWLVRALTLRRARA